MICSHIHCWVVGFFLSLSLSQNEAFFHPILSHHGKAFGSSFLYRHPVSRAEKLNQLRERSQATMAATTESSLGPCERLTTIDELNNSKRRPAPNKHVALQWIIESIDKLGGSQELLGALEFMQQSKSSSLRLVRFRSIPRNIWNRQFFNQNYFFVLISVDRKRNEKHKVEAKLRSLDLSKESFAVKERIIKACSDAGYSLFALSILQSIIQPNENGIYTIAMVPSAAAYGSVLNGLRRMGDVEEMEQLLEDLISMIQYFRSNHEEHYIHSDKSHENSTHVLGENDTQHADSTHYLHLPCINLVSFNSYLAALCDKILSPYEKRQMVKGRRNSKRRRKNISNNASSNLNNASYTSDDYLNKALTLIIDPSLTREKYCLGQNLDLFSYNTVLSAAAKSGDHVAVNAIYRELKEQQRYQNETWGENHHESLLKEDIYTYNALLRDAVQKNESGFVSMYDYEAHNSIISDVEGIANEEKDAIQLIDEILSNDDLEPDRYTVDLALLPLCRIGRLGDLINMVANYRKSCGKSNQEKKTMSEAFAAFLFTLVKGQERSTACSILENFLLMKGEPKDIGGTVPVVAKHFNILIEGYRRKMENSDLKLSLMDDKDDEIVKAAVIKRSRDAKNRALSLFDMMIETKVKPDAYTLTSLLSLQSTSSQITELWKDFVLEYKVQMTLPICHALITAYGKVNDPSSACYIFDMMIYFNNKERPLRRTLNSWNTIQAVFADESNFSSKLNFDDANGGNKVFSIISKECGINRGNSNSRFTKDNATHFQIKEFVDGVVCSEASVALLGIMNESNDIPEFSEQVPFPNSQTYCYVATSLSHHLFPNSTLALSLFQQSQMNSIPADGRFINAIIRCFGSDIDGAISNWKLEIGQAVTKYNDLRKGRSQNQNIIAAYHGLFNVCGQAGRPDIALRLVYAMTKKELVVNETALQCYEAGKKKMEELDILNEKSGVMGGDAKKRVLRKGMIGMYESLLVVECSKYEQTDKRRSGEKRVRIII